MDLTSSEHGVIMKPVLSIPATYVVDKTFWATEMGGLSFGDLGRRPGSIESGFFLGDIATKNYVCGPKEKGARNGPPRGLSSRRMRGGRKSPAICNPLERRIANPDTYFTNYLPIGYQVLISGRFETINGSFL